MVFVVGIPKTPKNQALFGSKVNKGRSRGNTKHVGQLIQNTEEETKAKQSNEEEYIGTSAAVYGKRKTAICVKEETKG
jgi:hypothetical protein